MDNYVGKRLDGRYEIQEIIGVGGMAVVYKAYDNIDDRIVAVKILKEEFLANDEFRRRFKNESKAIAVLSHPNIVKVYDVSFGDKLQYIVMEYVEGITLKEYIEQQKVINWKEAVHFTTQILRALQHAHDKGIVHRDVKPQNIMLIQNGNIKVTDFGIARFSRSETRTMTESAIGSVHYISPEQARGEVTDEKADIYSVGVVLYEMLTGTLPFQSDSAVSVAIMQLQQEAKRPREINDSIPIGLEQITMRAMQKNPRDRFQTSAEMLLDLDEFKRNPQMKFDYSYFIDDEPTKFVGEVNAFTPAPNENVLPEENYVKEKKAKSNVLPVFLGILISLVVVVGVIFGVIAIIKNSGDKIEVPDFKSKNYYVDIEGNEEYSQFTFEIDTEYNSSSIAGTVLKQTPSSGRKVKAGSTVKLVLAIGNSAVVPNDIKGMTLKDATSALEALGLKVSNEPVSVYSAEYTVGRVVDSDPKPGADCDLGTEVVLHVAVDKDPNAIEVPDLCNNGYTQEQAKLILEQLGLVLGTVTEVNSNAKKGLVAEQSIVAGTAIPKGTKIDISISNGIPVSSTVSINMTLPDAGGEGELVFYVNGEKRTDLTKTVRLKGNKFSCEITGSGATTTLEVTVNGRDYYSCTVDFTKTPAVISNEKYQSYGTGYASLPNVVGKTETSAKAALNNAGFYTINVDDYETNDSSKIGLVLGQTPEAGKNVLDVEKTSTVVTITVGRAPTTAAPSVTTDAPISIIP